MLWLTIFGTIAFIIALYVLVRYAKLPAWSHRDLLAFIALIATIGGAIVLTVLKWSQSVRFNDQTDRLISELVKDRPTAINQAIGEALGTIISALTWDLKLTSAGILVVLLSLGLVISSRVIRGKIWGSEFELSNEQREAAAAAAAARATADAADRQATDIAQSGPAAATSAGSGATDDGELPESEKIK